MNIFTGRHREWPYFVKATGVDGSLKNLINMAAGSRALIKRFDQGRELRVLKKAKNEGNR